jgi:hypothetical protein
VDQQKNPNVVVNDLHKVPMIGSWKKLLALFWLQKQTSGFV